MPLPSSENDLKRRARRRLIGAVALTLVAVIVLPLLLEDEPPPASSLAVHMVTAPDSSADRALQPAKSDAPDVAASQVPSIASLPVQPPEPKPESAKPESAKPESAKPESSKPKTQSASVQPPASPVPPSKPAAASSDVYLVQLAALADAGKAEELKARVTLLGLPAFTDKVGKLTRVRVGPYTARETAVAAAAKLAENKIAGGQVISK
jgi:DedD protein